MHQYWVIQIPRCSLADIHVPKYITIGAGYLNIHKNLSLGDISTKIGTNDAQDIHFKERTFVV